MITYVSNFEEAKNYPVMYGTSEVIFDNNQDKFYCKSVDRMGKSTMSTYEFHQVENEKPLTSADFVPREQFDALNSKLDNLMMLLSQSAPQPVSDAPAPQPIQNQQEPGQVADIQRPATTRRNVKEVTTNGKQPNA